jgi:hypothetical protein
MLAGLPQASSACPPQLSARACYCVSSAGLVLLLAKLCMFMEDSSVPYVMEVLAAGFQGRTGIRASDEPPPFVGGEVARRFGTAASELRSRCTLASEALAFVLRSSGPSSC